MLDFSYQNIVHSNLINFTVMIAIIILLFKKFKVSEKLEESRKDIQRSVEDSDSLKDNAEKEFNKIKESLKDLPKELEGILESAHVTAKLLETKSKEEIEQLIALIKVNAEKQVVTEEKQVQGTLTKNIGKSSVEIAKKQVTNTFEGNKELHRKVIVDFIDNLDRLEV